VSRRRLRLTFWRPWAWAALAVAAAAAVLLLGLGGTSNTEDADDGARDPAAQESRAAVLQGSASPGRGVPEPTADPERRAPGDPETVDGIVLDGDDRPVRSVELTLQGEVAFSAWDGAFSLPAPPFDHDGTAGTLVAVKEGFGVAQVPVTWGEAQGMRVILPPAAAVAGEVRGPGGALEGACVELRDGAFSARVVTETDGTFRFPGASTGPCEVTVTARGHMPQTVRVAPSVRDRFRRIRLASTREDVLLRIVDPSGEPLAGARVTAHWWSDMQLSRISAADGSVMLVPLRPAPAYVRVDADGVLDRRYTPRMTGDGELRVDVLRCTTLRVRLEGPASELRSGRWWVALFQPRGRGGRDGWWQVAGWCRLGPDGVAVLQGLLPGGVGYTVVAGRRSARGEDESFPHVIGRVDVPLPDAGGEIEGTLPVLTETTVDTAADRNQGVVPARLVVHAKAAGPEVLNRDPGANFDGPRFSLRTDDTGTARLWLQPGPYDLVARVPSTPQVETAVVVGDRPSIVRMPLARGFVVEGRIRNAGVVPLAGRGVCLFDRERQVIAGATSTDGAGRFRFPSVTEGTWSLCFDGTRGERMINGPVTVQVPGPPVELVAEEHSLTGVVETPSPESTIVVLRPQSFEGAETYVTLDEQGRFEVDGLGKGTWTVFVASPPDAGVRNEVVRVGEQAFVRIARE